MLNAHIQVKCENILLETNWLYMAFGIYFNQTFKYQQPIWLAWMKTDAYEPGSFK